MFSPPPTPSEPNPPADAVENPVGEPGNDELLERLRQDRLWLLRQLDGGRWPQWRLDLAALERELGQLLDQAAERLGERRS
jgi:hypothetical protein